MKSFDEWYDSKNFNSNSFDSDDEENWFKSNVKSGYEAGAQSRQSEVDGLKKKIDDALKVLNDASPTMLDKKAIKILKGAANET